MAWTFTRNLQGLGFQYFPTGLKLKLTWARDMVRPVVPARRTRGRLAPPNRNLVGVIKCASIRNVRR